MNLHICRTPLETIADEPNGEPRWCFRCRKQVAFRYIVRATSEPSYYEPVPEIRCEHGHPDGDLFPGRSREWL